MTEKGSYPARQSGMVKQGKTLTNKIYALRIYNTFGVFTTDKRIIREHIACGCIV